VTATAEATHTGEIPRSARSGERAITLWILGCAALVLAMVVVGGVTRLTRSGLSIVEWKPLTGVLPPIGEAAWQAEHAKYLATPEGRLVNSGMSLSAFKGIFYVEWAHRLLGRVTGAAVLLPFGWFVATRRLRGREAWRLAGIFALGGLQGLVGWLMVRSGLVDRPSVSHYRLALHLSLALLCFVLLLWAALDRLPRARLEAGRGAVHAALALAALAMTWGAFMAGLRAGHLAPTFPTMNGELVPSGVWDGRLGLANLTENAITVHFTHRLLAYGTAAAGWWAAWSVLRGGATSRAASGARALAGLIGLQIALGAATV